MTTDRQFGHANALYMTEISSIPYHELRDIDIDALVEGDADLFFRMNDTLQ